jgi:phage/plasmid-associated DNA primase
VTGATAAYLEAEDAFAAWIDEYCICDQQAWESTTTLYAAWKVWAERNGEFAGTVRRFAQTLEQRGQAYGVTYERGRRRGFRGLRLVGDASWREA